MPRHKLRFLPRYRNPSPLVGSDKRTEHRCASATFCFCPLRPGYRLWGSLPRLLECDRRFPGLHNLDRRRGAPYSGPSNLSECPPPHLRDPHAGDFHRASTCDHALGPCSRHPGADEINQKIDREPVREHDRLAAAVGGCGEQFEGAAALGLRAAPAA